MKNIPSTTLLKQNIPFDQSGVVSLTGKVWNAQVKPITVQNVVVAEQAAWRQSNSHTKDRSEVSGGGRKPWKQKGTGRARHGSRRSPIWVGGGITFGPTNQRNYRKKTNRKVFHKVLAGLLAARLREKRLFVTENCVFPTPKTKALIALFTIWKIDYRSEKILWIGVDFAKNLLFSSQNLGRVKLAEVQNISVFELLNSTKLLITEAALSILEKRFNDVSD